jgi:hypothetical protein
MPWEVEYSLPSDPHAKPPLFDDGQDVAALHAAQISGVVVFFGSEVAMTMGAGS